MTHNRGYAPSPDMLPQQEFRFTNRDFKFLSALAGKHSGINVTDAKRALVYSRLTRRLRQLGLANFAQYCAILERGDRTEIEHFVNAITTNLTSFFREPHHFHFLTERLVPQWLQRLPAPSARIWCAGCSTGEEPYSLAIAVLGAFRGHRSRRLEILATDLDSNVLNIAASGVYRHDRVEKISPELLRRWFLKGLGEKSGRVKVVPELRDSVEFRQHNIVADGIPEGAPFDAVFCRNVVIYFDQSTQAKVFNKFADSLGAKGHLFVGHSESLIKKNERFKLVGQSTYQKVQ